jgi:hypothetical protein
MSTPHGSVMAESVLVMALIGIGFLWLVRFPILEIASRIFVGLFFMEGYSEW